MSIVEYLRTHKPTNMLTETPVKDTPITAKHLALGAKMAPFAGYNMPISYKGITEEHFCVRQKVGIFDVSHMGEFIVKGRQALDLIQYVTSNDVSKLQIGDVQYSCLPNDKGGIVDDLLVYRLAEDQCAEGEQAFMLVVNASNIAKDWAWINQHNTFDARLTDISDKTALMAVQGPLSEKALQSLTDINLSEIKYYTFRKGTFAGVPNVLISATGYTGERGFEIYVAAEHGAAIWDAIMAAGAEHGIQPIGLGARDTLRLEMGFCLYGNDIDDTTSPLQASLGWITKLDKGNFIQRDALLQEKANGLSRVLVGFEVQDKRPARQGYAILNQAGEPIGVVTSGTKSPSVENPIGMGYVTKDFSKIGSSIFIDMRGKAVEAKVVRRPFYNR